MLSSCVRARSGLSVLVAEDSLQQNEAIVHIIKSSGLVPRVFSVYDGESALQLVEREQASLGILITDIEMPGLSGIELAERARLENPRIAVLILTAYDKFSYAYQAVNLGVFQYILKPITKTKIVSALERAIGHVRAQSDLYESRPERVLDELVLRDTWRSERLPPVIASLPYTALVAIRWDNGRSIDWGIVELWKSLLRQLGVRVLHTRMRSAVLLVALFGHCRAVTDAALGQLSELAGEERVLRSTFVVAGTPCSERADVVDEFRRIRHALESDELTTSRFATVRELDGDIVHRVNAIIQTSFMRNVGLEWISERVGLNPSYLSHLYKVRTGSNVNAVLREARLRHAYDLLKRTGLPIREVAEKSGFYNRSYFSSSFRKRFGVSPSEVRAEPDE